MLFYYLFIVEVICDNEFKWYHININSYSSLLTELPQIFTDYCKSNTKSLDVYTLSSRLLDVLYYITLRPIILAQRSNDLEQLPKYIIKAVILKYNRLLYTFNQWISRSVLLQPQASSSPASTVINNNLKGNTNTRGGIISSSKARMNEDIRLRKMSTNISNQSPCQNTLNPSSLTYHSRASRSYILPPKILLENINKLLPFVELLILRNRNPLPRDAITDLEISVITVFISYYFYFCFVFLLLLFYIFV